MWRWWWQCRRPRLRSRRRLRHAPMATTRLCRAEAAMGAATLVTFKTPWAREQAPADRAHHCASPRAMARRLQLPPRHHLRRPTPRRAPTTHSCSGAAWARRPLQEADLAAGEVGAAAGWVALAKAMAVDPVEVEVRLAVEGDPAEAVPVASVEVVAASAVDSAAVVAEPAAGRAIAPR